VTSDSLLPPPEDAERAQREQLMQTLHVATQRVARARRELGVVRERLAIEPKPKTGDDPYAAERAALKTIDAALEELDERLWGPKPVQGINRDDDGLIAKATEQMRVSGTDDAPNATERDAMQRAARRVPAVTAAVEEFVRGPLRAFRDALQQSGLSLLPTVEQDQGKK